MNWLRENAWMTGWFALPLAVLAIYAQNKGKQLKDFDWTWAIIYLTFGITLGVTLAQNADAFAREFAKWLATLSFFAILFNRKTN